MDMMAELLARLRFTSDKFTNLENAFAYGETIAPYDAYVSTSSPDTNLYTEPTVYP